MVTGQLSEIKQLLVLGVVHDRLSIPPPTPDTKSPAYREYQQGEDKYNIEELACPSLTDHPTNIAEFGDGQGYLKT